jgi:LmbE family N-acetylglucosaminyl deacetylase
LTFSLAKAGEKNKRLKILIIMAHPDDPETGCTSATALLKSFRHELVYVYFIRGEAGIEGMKANEAAITRTKEANSACAILGICAEFLGQIDGNSEVNTQYNNEMLTERPCFNILRNSLATSHKTLDRQNKQILNL